MTDHTNVPKPEDHPLGFELPSAAPLSARKAVGLGALLTVGLAAAFFSRYIPRGHERAALADEARLSSQQVHRVEITKPQREGESRTLVLPGSVEPLEETILYARSTGYVRKWYADIGDRVKEGALLAELDTPELDQELNQSQAQLAQTKAQVMQAKANRELAKMNLSRQIPLAPAVVSQAELDQTRAQSDVTEANVHVAEANVAAQEASLRRILQMKEFSRVIAPFAGTVTQRLIERGSLVTASNAQALFKVAATDPIRVFIQVPQGVAPSVRAATTAHVHVREYPDRKFDGTVTRSAGELDAMTRTMRTEVRVANGDGALLPGIYAEVSIDLASPHAVFSLPATAVLSDAKGQRVATVSSDHHLRFVPVVIERDNGSTVDVSFGLSGDEQVVKLASSAFVDGEVVDVTESAK